MRAPATDPVLQRLTGLEVHDIELCLLRHALVELGTVAEWEQNLEQDEHRGRDDGLVQTVEECRFATFEDSVANELQDPCSGLDGDAHTYAIHA